MSANRAHISEKTLKVLFARPQNRCAFPDCQEDIVDSTTGVAYGEACHIEGVELLSTEEVKRSQRREGVHKNRDLSHASLKTIVADMNELMACRRDQFAHAARKASRIAAMSASTKYAKAE